MVLIREGDKWVTADLRSFENERELQDVLLADPQLVPGCDGAIVVDELFVPGIGGRVDLLAIDDNGTITLIECKLNKNPQIRREVVGQVLAYASGLAGTPFEEFDKLFSDRAGRGLLEEMSAQWGEGIDLMLLRQRVEQALATGSFRLVFAVDQITSELRSIVEYLNEHTSDSVGVMALELGRLKKHSVEVLIPNTYGEEIAAAKEAKKPGMKPWSEQAIRDAVTELSPPERALVERLLTHADQGKAVIKGGTGAVPSAGFYYVIAGQRRSVWKLYVHPTGAVVALNLGPVSNASPQAADAMLSKIGQFDWFKKKAGSDPALWAAKSPAALVSAILAENGDDALLAALDAAVADESALPET